MQKTRQHIAEATYCLVVWVSPECQFVNLMTLLRREPYALMSLRSRMEDFHLSLAPDLIASLLQAGKLAGGPGLYD